VPDQYYQYSFNKPWVPFTIVQFVAVAVFVAGIYLAVSLWRRGQAHSLRQPANACLMLRALLFDGILHSQILRLSFSRWLTHLAISWGFVGLLLLTSLLALLEHVVPHGWGLYDYFILGDGRFPLEAWGDLWGILLLVGVVAAAVRRWVIRDDQLDTLSEDTTLLIFLFVLSASGFLLEAMRLSNIPEATGVGFSFVGYLMSIPLRSLKIDADYSSILWIFHMLAVSLFIAYVPFSKLMHAFAAPAQALMNISEEAARGDIYG